MLSCPESLLHSTHFIRLDLSSTILRGHASSRTVTVNTLSDAAL